MREFHLSWEIIETTRKIINFNYFPGTQKRRHLYVVHRSLLAVKWHLQGNGQRVNANNFDEGNIPD